MIEVIVGSLLGLAVVLILRHIEEKPRTMAEHQAEVARLRLAEIEALEKRENQ